MLPTVPTRTNHAPRLAPVAGADSFDPDDLEAISLAGDHLAQTIRPSRRLLTQLERRTGRRATRRVEPAAGTGA